MKWAWLAILVLFMMFPILSKGVHFLEHFGDLLFNK